MKKTLTIILLLFVLFYTRSQNQTYAVETIAFYNVENLFDHYDDPKLETMIAPLKGEIAGQKIFLKRS